MSIYRSSLYQIVQNSQKQQQQLTQTKDIVIFLDFQSTKQGLP